MEDEKRFKTKTGFCHILPDKILITRDGVIGNFSQIAVGNRISRILIIYTIFSIFLFFEAYETYSKGDLLQTIFFSLLGVYFVFGVLRSLNNSATPLIERDKIKEIKFKRAIVGLTRSRFEVFFEDNYGKIKKRLIMLPGSLSDGQNETEKALKLMIEEDLIDEKLLT